MNDANAAAAQTLVVVPETASLQEVVDALENNRVHAVAVLDDHGRLVGVLDEADLTCVVEPDGAPARVGGTPGQRRRRARRAQASAADLVSGRWAAGSGL